jgi:hypothetical protein
MKPKANYRIIEISYKLKFFPSLLRFSIAFLILAASGVAGDVLTFHNDSSRTGVNPEEIALIPGKVNVNSFGLKFNVIVAGQVYAQPLYASSVPIAAAGTFIRHNLVLVATEQDNVYAFDAESGALIWNTSLLGTNEVPADSISCSDLTPNNGVTGTPVIDRGMLPYGRIYMVAMSKTTDSGTYFQRLHSLDLSTGNDVQPPVIIQASYPGTGPGTDGQGHVIFNPGKQRQRAALVLANHNIFIAWGAFCDPDVLPYSGWIMGYDENTLAQKYVSNTNPNGLPISTKLPDGSGNGIWGAGGALAASTDNPAYIFVTTGNGPFDTNQVNGFPQNGDYGDTFLKLSPSLTAADYFTPYNQFDLATQDHDFGSSGTVVLPGMKDTNNLVRHLAVACGKDSNIYIVDRDNMGKYISGATSNANVYQEVFTVLPGGLYSTPAYFNGALYFGPNGHSLRRFKFTKARLGTTAASVTTTAFGYPGTTPSISAFGTNNGIVWAHEVTAGTNPGNSVLHAYDALNLATELYNSTLNASRDSFGVGGAIKFMTPTVCNGNVYVGTKTSLARFGLLTPTAAMEVTGSVQLAFGTLQYQSSTKHYIQSVTLTNTSGSSLTLPLSLTFDNLSANATLANASGASSVTVPSASPYINAPLSSPLVPGQNVIIQLSWIDSMQPPAAPGITYTRTRVLAGPNSR